MKKYVKLMGLLLSSTYLMGADLSHAADQDKVVPSGSSLLSVSKVPAAHSFSEQTVALQGRKMIHDGNGVGWDASQLEINGAKATIITQSRSGNYLDDTPAMKAKRDGVQALEVGMGDNATTDTRNPQEFQCDMAFIDMSAYYKGLRDGLRDFVTGETEKQLIALVKASKKLKLDHTPIGKVSALFPRLITEVKKEGQFLRESLNKDVSRILEALDQVVIECDSYVEHRSGPKPGQKFQDILLPDYVPVMAYSHHKPVTTRVALEGAVITDIWDMFLKVETTLKALMEKKLQNRLYPMDDFLGKISALSVETEYSSQIKVLSEPFRKYKDLFKFIDSQWVSPKQDNFERFQEGVKHINMLIENISQYVIEIDHLARREYAVLCLEGAKKGDDATTALAIDEAAPFKDYELINMASNYQGAQNAVYKKEEELASLIGRINKYLETPAI